MMEYETAGMSVSPSRQHCTGRVCLMELIWNSGSQLPGEVLDGKLRLILGKSMTLLLYLEIKYGLRRCVCAS